MLTFHPLERASAIAEDAVCLELQPPPALAAAYRFEAGQHLAVRAVLGGRELRRTYSIASPAGGGLRIGVRVQGEMSRYLAEGLKVGERLEALEPAGRFKPSIEAERPKSYVAIAAGSGITPILSIIGTLLAAEPASRVLLIYGNRSIARTMFLDEVLALKDQYLARLTLHFVMSREPQEVELFNGRLDAERLRALARSEFDPRAVDEYFLCGPGSMVKDVTASLRELGAAGRIHFERFGIDGPAGAGAGEAPQPATTAATSEGATVTVTMDGRRRSIQVARDRTILDAAGRRAGVAVFLPRRRLRDLSREGGRGYGGDEAQPGARGLGGAGGLRAVLSGPADERPRRNHLRREVSRHGLRVHPVLG
jgi:ring-1,2-phenylacetyl-CoA epoxidase subunit PaaE